MQDVTPKTNEVTGELEKKEAADEKPQLDVPENENSSETPQLDPPTQPESKNQADKPEDPLDT